MRSMRNSTVSRIGVLVVIEIGLVIGSFGLIAYYESQSALVGNSINAAGKNRFLTSNVLLEFQKYQTGASDLSKLNGAVAELNLNIDTLRAGGTISGGDLMTLPDSYLASWTEVDSRKNQLESSITEYLGQQPGIAINVLRVEEDGTRLIDASDALVTQLSEGAKEKSETLVKLQIGLLAVNVGVHAVMLYLIVRIVRPIAALTDATAQVKHGNYDVPVHYGTGKDEISLLASSFNEMLRRLKNHDKIQKEFIGIASHQLKGPIQPLLGYAQLSKEGLISKEEALDGIIQLAKKLQRVANKMLDTTKIQEGKLKYDFERTDICAVIENVVSAAHKNPLLIKEATIALGQCQRGEFYVDADRQRLEEAISNIVDNALKYASKLEISVDMRVVQNVIRIDIIDNGPGIPADLMPRLFDQFAASPSDGQGMSQNGTGLGLYISKAMVEAHGGKILVTNREKGGAIFSIELPASGPLKLTDSK